MLVRPGRLISRAAAAPSGPTYEDFVAYVDSLSPIVSAWDAQATAASSYRKTTAAAETGTMVGSPWIPSSPNGYRSGSGITCRVVQHSLPSQEVFNDQIANGRVIAFKISGGPNGSGPVSGVNRNGYSSASNSATEACRACTEILYYYQGQVWKVDPVAGTAPTVFSIT